jgi:hypothetical protein
MQTRRSIKLFDVGCDKKTLRRMGLVALVLLASLSLCAGQLLRFVPGRELVYNVVGSVDTRGEEVVSSSAPRSSGSVG